MDGKMWLGNLAHAQWVPCPATGMTRSSEGFSEEFGSDNGGLWINRSKAMHLVYEADFPVKDSSEYTGIESFARFASGEYGSDYIRFIDPMVADQNLFSAVWASPGLSEEGWKAIYDVAPTYAETTSNTYGKPLRTATYALSGVANAVPTGKNSVFTELIPTGYTLSIGASGTRTGTGVLRVQPINLDGTLATPVDITMSSVASAPAFSNTFSGNTYKAIRIYLTQTSAAASTISPVALWMQVLPTGTTATITRHIPGKGHMGLNFRGSARPETYVMTDRHLTGASIVLAEVEPWS